MKPASSAGDLIRGTALVVWADKDRQQKMDDIDTDQITPSDFCITTDMADPEKLWKAGTFRYLIPDFQDRVAGGDNFLVVGERFGIGSSREMSPAGIQAIGRETGQEIVIICGGSPGNIFVKNAVNLGLPVVVSPRAVADAGDGHRFSYHRTRRVLKNLTLETTYRPEPISDTDREILAAGGLIGLGRGLGRGLSENSGTRLKPATLPDRRRTYTREIIRRHRSDTGTSTGTGDRVRIRCDLLPASDGTAPFAIYAFNRTTGPADARPHHPHIVFDHFVFTENPQHRRQAEISTAFLQRYGMAETCSSPPGEGIFHIILPEKGLVRPGQTIAGADSHTRSLGAYGALGFGVGSTELGVGWATGSAYFTLGRQILIRFEGRTGPWVSGKDIALSLIARGDELGLRGSNLEFRDMDGALTVSDRHTLCNMMAEAEVVSAVFPPDTVTENWFRNRRIPADPQPLPGPDTVYDRVETIRLSDFQAVVAMPFSPSNVRPVSDLPETPVDMAIIGSCTNGQYRDLLAAARVLHASPGKSPRIPLIVYPGSRRIREQCDHPEPVLDGKSVSQILVRVGAIVRPSWCGPCFGQGPDCLTAGRTAVTTFNRNWPNRSGIGGKVYLASPAVAAATALKGGITAPV